MSWAKAVMQTLGKMVRQYIQLFTVQTTSPLLNVSKQPVKSGQLLKDAESPSVSQTVKRKRSVAPRTTADKLPKSDKAPVQRQAKKSTAAGKQSKTPVSKTPQRAKQAAKRKP